MAQERCDPYVPWPCVGAVHLGRPDPEIVPPILAGIDQVVWRQRIEVVADGLTEVCARLVATPGVREAPHHRPPSTKAPDGRDVPRPIVAVGVEHIADDVDGRQIHKLWPEVVAPNRGPIVCSGGSPIRAEVRNGNRDGERVERPVHVLARIVLSLTSPHDACPDANIHEHLALDPGSDLSEHWKSESRVKRFELDATAAAFELTLFAWLPDAAVIAIRPGMAPPPLVRVGVRVETQVGPRGQPVLPVAEFCDRLAVAREIMGHPNPGCDSVPVDQVVYGRKRLQR